MDKGDLPSAVDHRAHEHATGYLNCPTTRTDPGRRSSYTWTCTCGIVVRMTDDPRARRRHFGARPLELAGALPDGPDTRCGIRRAADSDPGDVQPRIPVALEIGVAAVIAMAFTIGPHDLGAIRCASRQLVGGGCCPAGRSSYQTRHSPGGGRWPAGIPCERPPQRPSRSCAGTGLAAGPRRTSAVKAARIKTPNSARGRMAPPQSGDASPGTRAEVSPELDGSSHFADTCDRVRAHRPDRRPPDTRGQAGRTDVARHCVHS